jgi:hypothetical protein
MARPVPLPQTDYIVLHTNYTGRFEKQDFRDTLDEVLKEHTVSATPLYVYDTICGHGLTILTSTHNPVEISNLQDIIRQVASNRADGNIVFKTNNFQDSFSLCEVLKLVQYCKFYSLDRINAFEATVNGTTVGIIIVDVGSESG